MLPAIIFAKPRTSMVRLKKRYWFLLIILLTNLILGFCGWHYWISFKEKYHLSIDWHGINMSFEGLSFDEFTISQPSQLSVTAKNLLVSWSQLSAKNIDIYWQPNDAKALVKATQKVVDTTIQDVHQANFDLSTISTMLDWLPKKIHIDSLTYYAQNNQQFDVKIDATKQLESIQLAVSSNNQYSAKLSTTLLFNEVDSRIDIQNGILTSNLSQFGIENSKLTLPFTGWISSNQFMLVNSGHASLMLEKANLSDDLILGRLESVFTFKVESAIPIESKKLATTTDFIVNKFDGIYKNSEIKSATGNIKIVIKDNQFTASVPILNIQEVNLGIAFEQVKLAGIYNAPLKTIAQGQLNLKKAQASIFSGSVSIKPSKLNLAKLPQQLSLRLKQIQLKEILAKYPAEGLAGVGTIDGYLPVTLLKAKKKGGSAFELAIKNGQLTTINEGYLQFENSALKNYAQNNPNMKILTDIIKNFHYTKLQGTVNYANEIAKLGLNIQGSNLDVENGKAVNLNINLEENMTKLLMSLQLSDQISEPVRKRIQAHLKKESSK
ncbi:hypothetical protein A9G45_12340 [Gilliamella sp. HK2]|uniref:intermembrane phospholipid transport protein YdbH family protein n=2 Tax=unclassified Gilliamella TaxID=2685620 RepID=UPI00080DB15F|nr:YdbH domain-containing protein [Gilliamella apicola]OCG31234.1 hypothetical protein A9G46_10845 [Gilliamella apicola]OCG32143.1 hypothetical protein A9G45_12340 [Gilliamella apicola]